VNPELVIQTAEGGQEATELKVPDRCVTGSDLVPSRRPTSACSSPKGTGAPRMWRSRTS